MLVSGRIYTTWTQIQVITSSIEGLKEPDSEKKKTFGMYGHLLLPEMKE